MDRRVLLKLGAMGLVPPPPAPPWASSRLITRTATTGAPRRWSKTASTRGRFRSTRPRKCSPVPRS